MSEMDLLRAENEKLRSENKKLMNRIESAHMVYRNPITKELFLLVPSGTAESFSASS